MSCPNLHYWLTIAYQSRFSPSRCLHMENVSTMISVESQPGNYSVLAIFILTASGQFMRWSQELVFYHHYIAMLTPMPQHHLLRILRVLVHHMAVWKATE